MDGPKPRVGVLLDGPSVPRWVHQLLRELAEGEDAALVAVGLLERIPSRASGRRLRTLPFRIYERLDRALFRAPDDHAAPIDATSLLEGVQRLPLHPIGGPGAFELPGREVDGLRARQLDVLVHLGSVALTGSVLAAARRGFWCFGHDELARHGTPPYFWEVHRGDEVTEATLLDLSAPDAPRVLYRSGTATDRMSLHRNRAPSYRKSPAFVRRCLRAVARSEAPIAGEGSRSAVSAPGPPRPLELLRFALRIAVRWWRSRSVWRRGLHWQWFVALRPRRDGSEADDLDGFVPLPVAEDRSHADPFLVEADGMHYLFFEEQLASEKGVIRCLPIAADGTPGPSRVVLERDYHLSYPFVFRWSGAYWMIPETSAQRTIELYRAIEFPHRWELEKVLFHDVMAVDSTLWQEDDAFWLFTAMSPTGAPVGDELFLFRAGSPLGPWTPHPMNPVVSDARRARPAGALFRRDGALIRPGQDCASVYLGNCSYGAAVWLNRVDVLDEAHYRETPIRRIGPEWRPGTLATHTLSHAGGFEALDGRRIVRRPRSRSPRRS